MILVTGAAGFIGHHLIKVLAQAGEAVMGIDNLSDYYDVGLKRDRLKNAGITLPRDYDTVVTSEHWPNLSFQVVNLADGAGMERLFAKFTFDRVCNLAAQAGVRYSLSRPQAYVSTNISGFVNVLENCRRHGIKHLVYASSSSVYGLNDKVPFAEPDPVDQPASLYAATKRSNELLAHVYAHLYNLPCTGLRFFTVYGPWGRPDMAYSLFSDAILNDRPIKVFNHGRMSRDFTYVDDIVEGLRRILLQPRAAQEGVPARLYNIGGGRPTNLLTFIEQLEKALGREARKEMLGMQPGDVEKTFADTTALQNDYGYRAETPLTVGIDRFVNWYTEYYGYTPKT